eukprot:5637149-Alexandrium_andersonii.AAC.1
MPRPTAKLASNSAACHAKGHDNSNSNRTIAGSAGNVAPRRAAQRKTSSGPTPATERPCTRDRARRALLPPTQ